MRKRERGVTAPVISVLGASVSTFPGYVPPGYPVFYTGDAAILNRVLSVSDIWWARVIEAFGGTLGVNESYSGSQVGGPSFPSAGCETRIRGLRGPGGEPDAILINMGGNDFGRGVPLGAENAGDEDSFTGSYRRMLTRLRREYPSSLILCETLPRSTIEGKPNWIFPENFNGRVPFSAYNDSIRRVCAGLSVPVADFDAMGLYYETRDGTHPTWRGHAAFAEAWIRVLERYFPRTPPRPEPPEDTVEEAVFCSCLQTDPSPVPSAGFVPRSDFLYARRDGYIRQLLFANGRSYAYTYPEEAAAVSRFLAALPSPGACRDRDFVPDRGEANWMEIDIRYTSGKTSRVRRRWGAEGDRAYPFGEVFAAAGRLTRFQVPFISVSG